MRVGVVCEGPTDFFAIKEFFGECLKIDNIHPQFIPLQPKMDNTADKAGWYHVLLWLQKNPPRQRIEEFFGLGLFNTSPPSLDVLLIQMDTDILGERGFCTYVCNTYGHHPTNPVAPQTRADEVVRILNLAAGYDKMTEADTARHVVAPAVESTETWCVAAFTAQPAEFEPLKGQALTDSFMTALERSESREPRPPYATCDKHVKRRRTFCEKLAAQANRVETGCPAFAQALSLLRAIARP